MVSRTAAAGIDIPAEKYLRGNQLSENILMIDLPTPVVDDGLADLTSPQSSDCCILLGAGAAEMHSNRNLLSGSGTAG
jgi:hypothetical protein